jgi:hypothetical protein
MLGERYLEVRYEALVADLPSQVRRIAAFLDLPVPADPGLGIEIARGAVGKWKSRSAREIADVKSILEPTLISFGYDWDRGAGPLGLGALGRMFERF